MASTERIGNQAREWDRLAAEKRFTISIDHRMLQQLLRPESAILDYGCGYGRIARELADAGFTNVVGVDTSGQMIIRARALNPDLSFATIDNSGLVAAIRHARSLDPSDAPTRDPVNAPVPADRPDTQPPQFDAILLVAVLTCIPDSEAQRHLVRQLTGLLRPGGLLCISDFVLQDDKRNRERYERFADQYGTYGVFRLPEGVVVRHHSTEWLDQLVSEFSPITREFPVVATMNGNRAVSYRWIGRLPE
jgi:SAM-dependent methyltransferase